MIIGSTDGIEEVRRAVNRVAATDTTVLVIGETGTGKSFIGRWIHSIGLAPHGPFVTVHCPSLFDSSSSFGHDNDNEQEALPLQLAHYFKAACGGTLYLNEIGDMPPAAQNQLVTLFENSGKEHGDSRTGNVRVIASTTRDLKRHSGLGLFRRDLLFRINAFPIHVAPLRDRSSDIVLLTNHFMSVYSAKHKKAVSSVSPEVIRALLLYRWPGNVRELEHVIEHAVLVCGGTTLEEHDLPEALLPTHTPSEDHDTFKELTAAYEKSLIRNALEMTRGNQSEAARILGTTKRIIQYKVGLYDIDYRAFRKGNGRRRTREKT